MRYQSNHPAKGWVGLEVTACTLVKETHDELQAEYKRKNTKHYTDVVRKDATKCCSKVRNSSSWENTSHGR